MTNDGMTNGDPESRMGRLVIRHSSVVIGPLAEVVEPRVNGQSQIGNRKSEIPEGLLPRREARRRLFRLYAGRGWTSVFCWLRYWHSNVPGIEERIPAEGTILDLGCGHGVLANYLALRSPRRQVIGFDLSERRIAVAKSIGVPNAEFRCQDLFQEERESVRESEREGVEEKNLEQNALSRSHTPTLPRSRPLTPPTSHAPKPRAPFVADVIVVADVLHHLRSYEEGDELVARCCGRLGPDGLLVIKEIGQRPLWKYWCTKPVDFLFYKGKVFFRSEAQFRTLFERLGLEAEFLPLHTWRPLCHVMYLCRRLA